MPRIKFIKNWNNKLNCDYWTTIRLYTIEKYNYYKRNQIVSKFDVMVNDRNYYKANLIDIQVMPFVLINDYVAYTDAGMSKDELFNMMEKMYSKKPEWKGDETNIMVMTFKRGD